MSEYMGSTIGAVTLICPEHGRQTSTPRALMINQYKCNRCAIDAMKDKTTKGYENFLEYARKVHGDKYEYPHPEEYVNRKSIITLICPEHGEFKKKVQKHLAGQACFRCKIDQLIAEGRLPGGYSEEKFLVNPELAASAAHIYYLRVGDYYKVGITKDHLERRVSSIRHRAKQPVVVVDSFDCTLLEAYRYEQAILSDFAEARVYLDWSSEVFYEDVLNGMTIESYLMLRAAPVGPSCSSVALGERLRLYSTVMYRAGTVSVSHTPFSACWNVYPWFAMSAAAICRMVGLPRRAPTCVAVWVSAERCTCWRFPLRRPCFCIEGRLAAIVPW